ncbi:PREDICTED: coiled-coil domain-containing protein 22 homolog isoform X2 [Amphimedon queenslandica]|uniref:Coiled-coil domain-containing protein 22 homolog n=1 Tax=Amphimedon queenslandica TaxID=400682 RepID=A0AAN0J7E3_AMPQE|nr:PREDICTED: coiled-coil domain-containing protein 22 homolog isoform X2 [Amphimedon queenslandica]|eukprot:XP_019852672.1 PREDICTED: coiled-coil domain-containing protein 22 homolog isoform X2 [Amphimedon queenslandica]
MEEVDGIIISTLKEVGCDFEDEIASLTQFTPEMVVEASVRCLQIIIPEFQSPTHLPDAMSARFRMCTGLANACQELGFQAEVGYQTFLYSSVKDWRKLLMFLLEKLPKEAAQTADEPTGAGILLTRSIGAEIGASLRTPWTPSYCKRESVRWTTPTNWRIEGSSGLHAFTASDVQAPTGTGDLQKKIPKEVKLYYAQEMPYVVAQPVLTRDVLSSLLAKNDSEVAAQQEWEAEWNQAGLASRLSENEYKAKKKQKLMKKLSEQLRAHNKAETSSGALGLGADLNQILSSFFERSGTGHGKGSRFQHAEKLQFAKEEDAPVAVEATSEEDLQQQREQELATLREQLNDWASQYEKLELDIKKYTAGIERMREEKEQQELQNKENEDAYRIKKGTYDLLPQADENIEKLKGLVQTSSDRIAKLAKKWEEIRGPMMKELRELKSQSDITEIQIQELLQEIQILREGMKEVADETRLKDELYKQLVGEYERMTKDTSRSAYTRRIMEIVANIKKQKEEINKILTDTKYVQKEINQLSGKLDRVFQVTDEQVFKDARKDEARRSAYKLLASIRDNSKQVVEAIHEAGQIKREQRYLEEQV